MQKFNLKEDKIMNLDKFTIVSYDQIAGFDRQAGMLALVMDEINDFTLSQEEEKNDITGKGGRVIGSQKKNKKVTGKGTNGMLSGGALATQLGADIEDGDQIAKWTDVITVTANKGNTSKKAEGTVGNEIGYIYIRNKDQEYISGGKRLTQTSGTPATGQFSYNPDTNEITFFDGDVADGVEVITFYNTKVEGKKISDDSDHYSKVLEVIIDVTCQDACDNQFHGQFLIKRADFSGTFDIAGGSDPATHGFEFTSLPDICTGKTDLWDFIVFDD